jgi:hypothetical protein
MLPAEIAEIQKLTDSELARKVQESASNEAMCEIINRHTGIYMNVVNGFKLPNLIKDDLKDQKDTNIYSYTLDYNPNKGMKLSSWLHQKTRWDCLHVLRENVEMEELTNETIEGSESFSFNDSDSVKNEALKIARTVGGHEFEKVIEARYFGDDSGKVSWHSLKDHGLTFSHEKSRKVHDLAIEKFKEDCKAKFSYTTA